jgi:hypothetical protein
MAAKGVQNVQISIEVKTCPKFTYDDRFENVRRKHSLTREMLPTVSKYYEVAKL